MAGLIVVALITIVAGIGSWVAGKLGKLQTDLSAQS
jgi:Flp pilus assembly pilin Flp